MYVICVLFLNLEYLKQFKHAKFSFKFSIFISNLNMLNLCTLSESKRVKQQHFSLTNKASVEHDYILYYCALTGHFLRDT